MKTKSIYKTIELLERKISQKQGDVEKLKKELEHFKFLAFESKDQQGGKQILLNEQLF